MGGTRMGVLPYDRDHGGVGGAIIADRDRKSSVEGTLVYLNGGDDLNRVLDRVKPAGGTVLTPKTAIGPDMGHFALSRDCEGNKIGLYSRH